MPRRRSPPDKKAAPPNVPPSWEQGPDLSRLSPEAPDDMDNVRLPRGDRGATMMTMTAAPTEHCI